MDLLTALANHWILALFLLLIAFGATVLGMTQILLSSMRRPQRESQARCSNPEEDQKRLAEAQEAEARSAFTLATAPAPEQSTPAFSSTFATEEPTIAAAEKPGQPGSLPFPPAAVTARIGIRMAAYLKHWFTPQPDASEFSEAFDAAFQYLASRVPDRAGEIPLYLVAGPAQAGKSALLAQTQMPWRWRQNQRTFGSASGIQWNFCEHGVLLELPGGDWRSETGDASGADEPGRCDRSGLAGRSPTPRTKFVGTLARWSLRSGFDCRQRALALLGAPPSCGDGSGEVWEHLPRLLLRHRPRRPLDGVVLVLPADLLLGGSMPEVARHRMEQVRIRKEIQRAAHALAMHLPLYVIVSKCDLIPGFVELADEIPAHKRGDCLGWSNPHPATAQGDASILDEACRDLRRIFLRLAAETAMHHDPRTRAAEDGAWMTWMDLDRRLPEMLDALRLELAALLESGSEASLLLRGIYLCGDIGEGGTAISDIPGAPAPASAWPHVSRVRRSSPRPGFVDTLFLQRIFPERGIAVPAGLASLARQPRAVAMQVTAAALLLVLGLGTTASALHLIAWRDQRILPMLIATDGGRPAPPAQQFQAIVRAGEQPLRSWLLPASMLSGVHADLQQQMQQALGASVYPAMEQDLQQQARQLAQHWVAVASDPPPEAKAPLRIARPDQLAEFTILQQFSHDWLHLQDEIDAYQGLAHADHPPSPAEIQRFLTHLGAPSSAPLTTSSPVYRAILAAHGPAFVASIADQHQASQVMHDLVRRFLYRWYMGNELVNDMQKWSRLPQDASGDPARAALAAQLRKELADPALAPVLQDDNRPAGPLDSIAGPLVHRSGYLDPGLHAFIQNEATGDAQQVRSLAEQLRTPTGNALIAFKDGHWRLAANPR